MVVYSNQVVRTLLHIRCIILGLSLSDAPSTNLVSGSMDVGQDRGNCQYRSHGQILLAGNQALAFITLINGIIWGSWSLEGNTRRKYEECFLILTLFTVGEAVRSTNAWNLLSCSSKYEKELKELIRRLKTMNLLIKLHYELKNRFLGA